jgi:hypothetical protein
MKISDMIKALQKIESEHGDIDVVVQYRDDGGCYTGCDAELIMQVGKKVEYDAWDEDKETHQCVYAGGVAEKALVI